MNKNTLVIFAVLMLVILGLGYVSNNVEAIQEQVQTIVNESIPD
jgi:sulfite exporter TauE/SafE